MKKDVQRKTVPVNLFSFRFRGREELRDYLDGLRRLCKGGRIADMPTGWVVKGVGYER